MGLLYKYASRFFSILGISLAGGALAHNLAQLTVAFYVVRAVGIFAYLPYMLFFALPTGFFCRPCHTAGAQTLSRSTRLENVLQCKYLLMVELHHLHFQNVYFGQRIGLFPIFQ